MIVQRNSAQILGVEVLKREDLAFLQEKRVDPVLKKLRDSHRMVARLLVAGLAQEEVAAQTGYTSSTVSLLSRDPAMIELMAQLRKEVDQAYRERTDEIVNYQVRNTIMSLRQINEQLEDADDTGEPIPLRNLIAIAADGADRVGYGKRSTTVNVNVDFAAKLEAARRRSAPVIDAKAVHGDEAA